MLGCIKLAVLLIFCCPVLHFFLFLFFTSYVIPALFSVVLLQKLLFFLCGKKKKFLRINKHFSVSPDLQCGFLLYLLLCYL